MKNKDDNPPYHYQPEQAISLIRDRRSVRAFLNKNVDKQLIESIFNCAKWAPSGVNTQPWQVAILGEQTQNIIAEKIIAAREAEQPENPDYQYYPTEWVEPYKTRRKSCGAALYQALGIEYHDKVKRKTQWYKNYSFFGAPIGFIFYLEKKLCKGSWVDMGMFIQNVSLAARGLGLETCAQASLAEYPDIIRDVLQISPDYHIVCGMAVGYADWEDPVNQYRTEREPLESFLKWID